MVYNMIKEGRGKALTLEEEFWSYVGASDGKRCPLKIDCNCNTCYLSGECDVRTKDGWCLDSNLDSVIRHYEKFTENCDQESVPPSCDFPFRNPCRIFRLVEFVAYCYLNSAGVSCLPVPMSIAMLADVENGVEVRLVPLKAYHGSLWRSQGKWIVQLNVNDTPARRRFTIFHEVFHIRAHLETTPVFAKVGSSKASFSESLADYFAACVLAPPHWVKKEWTKFKDIRQMAAHFNVPYFVMLVMLKRVGLVALLCSLLIPLALETPFC